HQVERPPEHRDVGARSKRVGVGYVGPVARLDDAPLANDPLVAPLRSRWRGDPQGGVQLTTTDLVDLVLRSSRDVAVADRLTLAGQGDVVHPYPQPIGVAHRF